MNLALTTEQRPRHAPTALPGRERPVDVARPSAAGSMLLQRRATGCPCGGGCPRCRESGDGQLGIKSSRPEALWEQEAPPDGLLQRQEDPASRASEPLSLPPLTIPGTHLTLIPGLLRPSLLGPAVPLPARLRLTNAREAGSEAPFIVDLSPNLLLGSILGNVDLYTWTRPGTPPDATDAPENQARISLVNPTLTLNPRAGRLGGSAVLSIGSSYPDKPPTEVRVEISSSDLGRFIGQIGYGPLHADFSLRLHYDTRRLEEALSPVATPQGGFAGLWTRFQTILRETVPGIRLENVSGALQSILQAVQRGEVNAGEFTVRTLALLGQSVASGADLEHLRTSLQQFGNELLHPGFTVSGRARAGPVPSGFNISAPTTVPLAHPLLGAPTALPLSYSVYGVILAPPGSIAQTTVPAFGYTTSRFGATSGTAFTVAALPSLSPSAITEHEPLVRQIPVYAYAEFTHVRRISSDLDLGIRLTVQVSTPDLAPAGGGAPSGAAARLSSMLRQYQEAARPGADPTGREPGASPAPAVPNLGLTVLGRFDAF